MERTVDAREEKLVRNGAGVFDFQMARERVQENRLFGGQSIFRCDPSSSFSIQRE